MKKSVLFFALVVFTFNSFSQSRQVRKAEKKADLEAKFNATKALLESKSFQFEANWANPLGNDAVRIGQSLPGGAAVFQGNRVSLTGNSNYVKITGDKANIALPFFGRVFFPSRINSNGGINYKGNLDNYSVSLNEKKKAITIKFKAKSDNDQLIFILRVNAGGGAILNVNSTNRQTIAYDGVVKALDLKQDTSN